MTEKEIVLETIRALPDDCSLEEIAERIEFMAAVQKGLDQIDRGEGIPHDEVKKQLASWNFDLRHYALRLVEHFRRNTSVRNADLRVLP
jgi:hypothetical protein